MSVDAIRDEYVRLRRMGLDGGTVLAQLVLKIAMLSGDDQKLLLLALERWEQRRETPGDAFLTSDDVTSIELDRLIPNELVRCPNCGMANPATQVMCFACGQFMVLNHAKMATQTLEAAADRLPAGSYFGPYSLLVLKVKVSDGIFMLRPQLKPDLFIIGRGAHGVVKADRDLGAPLPAMLGVSRVHLGLIYDEKRCVLHVIDLGSANGTLLNSQPLYAQETRLLRHGDELTLGRLPLAVSYHHPAGENDTGSQTSTT